MSRRLQHLMRKSRARPSVARPSFCPDK
jgi:hypothetical protein